MIEMLKGGGGCTLYWCEKCPRNCKLKLHLFKSPSNGSYPLAKSCAHHSSELCIISNLLSKLYFLWIYRDNPVFCLLTTHNPGPPPPYCFQKKLGLFFPISNSCCGSNPAGPFSYLFPNRAVKPNFNLN